MSFLHSLLSLPREGLVIAACVVIGLLVVFLFALFSRRRYVTIKQSEETELLVFHIRRIADALERLSVARETHSPVDSGVSKHAGMSTFGH
jgi:hypothetical protein